MEAYKITAELNLEKIIAESREVAQALNEFADNLEQIERKYAEPQERENEIKKACANCKHLDEWDPTNKTCPCQYCNRVLLNKWEGKDVLQKS